MPMLEGARGHCRVEAWRQVLQNHYELKYKEMLEIHICICGPFVVSSYHSYQALP